MILVSDKVDHNKWNSVVEDVGINGTLFQSTYWAEYLRREYRDRPIYIASIDKKGSIQGLLLAIESCYALQSAVHMPGKRGVVLGKIYTKVLSSIAHRIFPFIYWAYGPIILPSVAQSSRETLYKSMIGKVMERSYARRCYAIKFARPPYYDDRPEVFSSFGFQQKKMGTVLVNLDKPEQVWLQVHESTRRLIRRTIEKGVYINEVQRLGELWEFYRVQLESSRRTETKEYPFSYYTSLWNYFYPRGKIVAFVARLRDQPVGALLLLTHNEMLHAWAMGDSNHARSAKLQLNRVLVWHAINWGHSKQFKHLDLSGVELWAIDADDKKRNIFAFKSQWGTMMPEYHDYTKTLEENRCVKLLGHFMTDSVIHN